MTNHKIRGRGLTLSNDKLCSVCPYTEGVCCLTCVCATIPACCVHDDQVAIKVSQVHAIGQCERLLILEPPDTRTGTSLNVTLQDSRLSDLDGQVLHLTGEERRLEDGQRGVGADGARGVEGGTRVHTRVAYLDVVDVELC